MTVRRLAEVQPDNFAFTQDNRDWADAQLKKFPEGRQASAVIPLLWRAQEQHDGWLPEPAIRHVGEILDMPHIRVLEIATFYTQFNLEPVGEFFVQVCGTTPCQLCGAGDLIKVCERVIGPQRHVTEDGKLSWLEVECLGACCNAPMAQINKDYYEDLTPEIFEKILADLREGREVKPGPQNGRTGSEPKSGPKTLTDPSLYENRRTLVSDATNGSTDANANESPQTDKAANENAGKPDASDRPAEAAAVRQKPGDGPDETRGEGDDASGSKGESRDKVSAESGGDGGNREDKLGSGDRPEALDAPSGGVADDLKRISGIGPKIEETLNGVGIFHFSQIARWTEANKAWVDDYLSFKGRIDREDWIGQARTLGGGGDTDFAERVDKGDVPSSKE